MRTLTCGILFLLMSMATQSQDLKNLDSISTLDLIDTLFVDRDLNNWSFRLYTNAKEHRVRYSHNNSSVTLFPNNPFGVGFGVATRKLLLDIGFNIKPGEEETNRFDMQGMFMPKYHQVGFFYQRYQGFNVRNNETGISDFREDIVLQSSGINYLYKFNANEYSFSSLKTGLARQKKSSYTFGVGGFFVQLNQRADSTFVSPSSIRSKSEKAFIVNSSSIGLGASAGFSGLIVLPKNFFIGLSCIPGLGLSYTRVETEQEEYVPGNPLVYQLGLMADFGYNGDNIYVNLSINNNTYGSDLEHGNRATYNQTKAKLAIGFKYGRKKLLKSAK